jgi:CRP-like cAMP-binding protein
VVLLNFLGVVCVDNAPQHSWQIRIPNLLFQCARLFVILSVSGYVASTVWNVDLGKVAQALGVGSLVIALALQDTLSNLVSGFLLIFEAPFKVGDYLRIGDVEGEVIELNWRAVRVMTGNKDVVIIPNGVLAKGSIYNYTLLNSVHGQSVVLRFSYEDAPNRVRSVLLDVALDTEGVEQDPAPSVRTISYDDFSISYELKYYVHDFTKKGGYRNKLMTRIYYAARRKGLTMPLPISLQYNVDRDLLPADQQPMAIAQRLKSLPYFQALREETIDRIAEKVVVEYYGIEENVVEAGELDEAFYVILSGQVKLIYEGEREEDNFEVTRLKKGDFFGEMVLLPTEASLVTVSVIEDLRAIALSMSLLASLIQRNPRFAQDLNGLLSERRRTLDFMLDYRARTSQRLLTAEFQPTVEQDFSDSGLDSDGDDDE